MKTRAGVLMLSMAALGGTTLALAQQHGGGRHPDAGATAHPDAGAAGEDAATIHAASDAGSPRHGAHDAGMAAADAAVAQAGPPPTSFDLPMSQRGTGAISHYPIPEQLARNDIPVFVQVHSSAPLDHVQLFYRGRGASRFRTLRMNAMGQDLGLPGGYGAQIPCEDAFPPAVEYYVEAVATSGVAVGTAGTSGTPISLPIVLNRTRPIVPTLPGQPAPRSCGSIQGTVAGPSTGTTTSHGRDGGAPTALTGTADLGEPCAHNNECRRGLRCATSHVCVFINNQ